MQKTKWKYNLLMKLCFILLLAGCSKKEETTLKKLEPQQEVVQQEETQDGTQDDRQEDTSTKLQGDIVVHVCGEVLEEGVYTLPAGSRIYQAIEQAGGMTDLAASTYLNQADFLTDGQSIVVPSKDEVEQGQFAVQTGVFQEQNAVSGKVNINTATKEELMTLTGIGESKAMSILDYRETNGKFQAIEELKNISGIGNATFEKFKEQITVL